MKHSTSLFLSLATLTITTAYKLALEDFEKCKEGSELIAPPQCPGVDPDLPVYLPFPNDCEQYYECSNGIARCLKCAPGTVWDQENLVCNHPVAVNCTVVPTTAQPISSTAPHEPPENVICNAEIAGLFAHPDKCSLFILCDPGRLPCIIECPEGTCFNNNTNTCEYPYNIDITNADDQNAKNEDLNDLQSTILNYRNVKRDNFAEAVQFVANTLTNRINRRLETKDEDSCEMLNIYIRNA